VDAHKLAVLDALAKQHGFQIGLASIECHVEGAAEGGPGWAPDYGRNRYGYYDGSEEEEEVYMAEILNQMMTITNLVDLDGNVLVERLPTGEVENECIPEDLQETVEDGAPDEEEYEGYKGNVCG